MAIYGTGGSGKSAALRGIAIAAAVTPRGGPVHVYGIDCGSSGLKMLEELPHVGEIINGDDVERVGRLLRWLRDLAEDRSARFAEVRASTIVEYRKLADHAGREAHLRAGGRHVQPSARRTNTAGCPRCGTSSCSWPPTAVPWASTSLSPVTGPTPSRRRCLPPSSAGWCCGCPSEDDYMSMDVPKDVLGKASPPGRGLLGGHEVQLAVLGGNSNLALQAREVHKLSEAMLRQGVEKAPQIERLPEQVDLDILPAGQPGPAGDRRGRRNAAARRDHGQGPAAAGRSAGRRPDRGAGDHGLRAAPVQPRHRTGLHRRPGGPPWRRCRSGTARWWVRTTSRRRWRS